MRTALLVVFVSLLSPRLVLGLPNDASGLQVAAQISATTDPSASGTLPGLSNLVVLEGGTDQGKVSARVGLPLGSNVYLSLLAKGTIGEGATDSPLAELSGLNKGSSGELRLVYLGWQPPVGSARTRVISAQDAVCAKARERHGRPKAEASICQTSLFRIREDRDLLDRFLAASFGRSLIPFYAISLKAARSDFKWVEAPEYTTSHSGPRTGWSLGATLGGLSLRASVLSVGFRYERSFSADPPTSVCRPLDSTPVLQCDSLIVGPPKERVGRVLTLEYRESLLAIGYQFRASYDVALDKTALSFDTLFLKNKDGRFVGGVRGAWTSDTGKFAASLFVGLPVELF